MGKYIGSKQAELNALIEEADAYYKLQYTRRVLREAIVAHDRWVARAEAAKEARVA